MKINTAYLKLAFVALSALAIAPVVHADSEGMKQMPQIQPKRTFVVHPGDDLERQRGFGGDEPMVKMMNLMMVEGSGMEKMNMHMVAATEKQNPAQIKAQQSSQSPYDVEAKSAISPPKAGSNLITLSIRDRKTKKPVTGLKLKAQVYMTSMDMGTDEPAVKEIGSGQYQLDAAFAMKGPWAVKVMFDDKKSAVFDFAVQSSK